MSKVMFQLSSNKTQRNLKISNFVKHRETGVEKRLMSTTFIKKIIMKI